MGRLHKSNQIYCFRLGSLRVAIQWADSIPCGALFFHTCQAPLLSFPLPSPASLHSKLANSVCPTMPNSSSGSCLCRLFLFDGLYRFDWHHLRKQTSNIHCSGCMSCPSANCWERYYTRPTTTHYPPTPPPPHMNLWRLACLQT